MWFTEFGSTRVGRIDPHGRVTEYEVPGEGEFEAIAAGPDGALWFTSYAGGTIGRLTTHARYSTYPAPRGDLDRNPFGLAAGPDRGVWFTNDAGATIGRVAARYGASEKSIVIPAFRKPK